MLTPSPSATRRITVLLAALLGAAALTAALTAGSQASGRALGIPAGGPVPAHTRATSVSFVSPGTAYVLGTARCRRAPCSAILRTTDRGRHWVGLPAPRESVGRFAGAGLWGLRFADLNHGFAYGAGLWQTSDAGAVWSEVPAPALRIADLEPVTDRWLIALGLSCSHRGTGVCRLVGVDRRAVTGGPWRQVRRLGVGGAFGSITVHAKTVWVLAGTQLLRSTDAAAHFASVAQPCRGRGAFAAEPASLSDDGSGTYLLCAGSPGAGSAPKLLYRFTGRGWRLLGRPPMGGDGSLQVAVASGGSILISASSGASWLFQSTDGGPRWSTALQLDSGGIPWGDLGFSTAQDGVVIEGPAYAGPGGGARYAPGRVWLTQDGGQHWSPTRF